MFEEEVRGVVVGVSEEARRYRFYTKVAGIDHLLDEAFFEDDDAAEAYIKDRYPKAYARGIEMRVSRK